MALPLDPEPYYVVEADDQDLGPDSGAGRYSSADYHEDSQQGWSGGTMSNLAVFKPRAGYEQDQTLYYRKEWPRFPLDPEPWTEQGERFWKWKGAYLPTGQLATEFAPRDGYSQNREDYP